jgi:hypothetical protein
MSVQPVAWPEPDPLIAAAIGAKYPGKRPRPRPLACRSETGWANGCVGPSGYRGWSEEATRWRRSICFRLLRSDRRSRVAVIGKYPREQEGRCRPALHKRCACRRTQGPRRPLRLGQRYPASRLITCPLGTSCRRPAPRDRRPPRACIGEKAAAPPTLSERRLDRVAADRWFRRHASAASGQAPTIAIPDQCRRAAVGGPDASRSSVAGA